MNYPPKPWTDGQTFTENGTVYTYDLSTNSWKFNKLTYNRLQNAVCAEIPQGTFSVKVEFSTQMDFSEIDITYDSTIAIDRMNMLVSTEMGIFSELSGQTVSTANYSKFYLIPDLDLSIRYFGRLQFINNGNVAKTVVFIVPGITI